MIGTGVGGAGGLRGKGPSPPKKRGGAPIRLLSGHGSGVEGQWGSVLLECRWGTTAQKVGPQRTIFGEGWPDCGEFRCSFRPPVEYQGLYLLRKSLYGCRTIRCEGDPRVHALSDAAIRFAYCPMELRTSVIACNSDSHFGSPPRRRAGTADSTKA